MLTPPLAGVGRIHADHSDAAAGSHGGEPVPETPSGDPRHGTAKSFSSPAAAQGFTPGTTRVGEVEVFDHHRRATVVVGEVEQCGDRRADPPVPVRGP